VGSPALLVGAWLVTAVMTIIGALSYGELAAMMPGAGGQYIYLREALGRIWGFLFGWTLFLVIQTGTIAAVAGGLREIPGRLLPFGLDDELGLAHRARPRVEIGPHGAGQHGYRHQHREPGPAL